MSKVTQINQVQLHSTESQLSTFEFERQNIAGGCKQTFCVQFSSKAKHDEWAQKFRFLQNGQRKRFHETKLRGLYLYGHQKWLVHNSSLAFYHLFPFEFFLPWKQHPGLIFQSHLLPSNRYLRVSVQGVKSVGGHFACLLSKSFCCYYFSKRKWKYFYTFNHFYSEKPSKRAKQHKSTTVTPNLPE